MSRSGETAATSLASESSVATTLCNLDIYTVKLEAEEDICVAFSKIPPGTLLTKIQGITINKFTQWDKSGSRMGRLFYYNAEHEVLIIKTPISLPHERMHGELFLIIHDSIRDAGLEESYAAYGQTTFYMKQGASITSAGEGDSSLGTLSPADNNGWPTVVAEAGWSQTRPALVAKAHWWFEASNGAVKIVLLAFGGRNQIQIEKWKARRLRSGRLTRLALSSPLQPELCPPVVTITRPSGSLTPANYTITGSPLRLEYSEIFPHGLTVPQGDLEQDDATLREYASRVWITLENS